MSTLCRRQAAPHAPRIVEIYEIELALRHFLHMPAGSEETPGDQFLYLPWRSKIDRFSKFSQEFLDRVTLTCLITEQGLISEQGGIFLQFNKRAGWNKRAGRNIFKSSISEQGQIKEQVGI